MKTAEEWANHVIPDILLSSLPKGWVISFRHDIAKALTAFAEERVKEAFVERGSLFQASLANVPNELAEARAESLEEAAKVVEKYGVYDLANERAFETVLAERIRALKEKP